MSSDVDSDKMVRVTSEVHCYLEALKVGRESFDSVIRRVLHGSDISGTPAVVEEALNTDEGR